MKNRTSRQVSFFVNFTRVASEKSDLPVLPFLSPLSMHAATLSVTQPRLLCMRRRRRFCAGFVWMPSCLAGDSHCIGFASTRRGVLFILVQNLAFPFFLLSGCRPHCSRVSILPHPLNVSPLLLRLVLVELSILVVACRCSQNT